MSILRLSALLAALPLAAAAPWAPLEGMDAGRVLTQLVADGSRVCAGTMSGIYCIQAQEQQWRPAFLEGKQINGLARIRTGWLAIASEPVTDIPPTIRQQAYLSRDEGVTWDAVDWLPGFGSWNWHQVHAYGDSLLRTAGQTMELSEDAGLSWKPVSPPPPVPMRMCLPSSQCILCVAEDNVYRKASIEVADPWMPLGDSSFLDNPQVRGGRIYVLDVRGVLAVYGPAGRERVLPALPTDPYFKLLLAGDSLILARSSEEIASVRGRAAAWTRQAAPYEYMPFRRAGGVWTSWGALVLSAWDSPQRMSVAGDGFDFEPFSLGLRDGQIQALAAAGNSLLVLTRTALWRGDAERNWRRLHAREPWVTRFWIRGGLGMVGTYPVQDGTPASLFTSDTGRTWQEQPGSLPGTVIGLARIGESFLALSDGVQFEAGHREKNRKYSLHEARAWPGPWTLRADLPMPSPEDLEACGARLYLLRYREVHVSDDTGRTWMPTGMARLWSTEGETLYALDSSGRLHESKSCGEEWSPVPVPWSGAKEVKAINPAGGQPLAAVFDRERQDVSVYPLPGASPEWAGIESHRLPIGSVNALRLHAGILYAGLEHRGLWAMDAPPTAIGPRVRTPPAGPPRRFPGWRRVDGRSLPPGAVPAHTPVFRPGPAR